MTRTLIIGIGNPLRGDDGLGWRALESLRQMAQLEDVDTIVCHQLTPEMAASVARAERVLFIDACAGHPPGEIRVSRLRPAPSSNRSLTHDMDPEGLLKYSLQLYGASPAAWTISMTGAEYDYSEALSAAVESRLAALVDVAAHIALLTE